jgi:hypothetical protein
MTAMTAAQAGMGALQVAAQAIPGRMERMYRKDILADRKRLQAGRGGMSAGNRERGRAEGRGFIASQEQEALAQVARGSSAGTGASGVRTQMAGDIRRAGMAAGNQVDSAVRQQDLDLAQQQRQGLQGRMLQAYKMGATRKAAATQAEKEAGFAGFDIGQLGRGDDAKQIDQLTGYADQYIKGGGTA